MAGLPPTASNAQIIQDALDKELNNVPTSQQGESELVFEQAVYNDLIAAGLTSEQANGVKTYLMNNQYGGPSGYIGQGGGANSFRPTWKQQAQTWAQNAAAAIASIPGNTPASSGQCSSTSPEFCTLAQLLGTQMGAGAPISPYLQDNNTPTVVPTQSTSKSSLVPIIVLFLIAGAAGYWYYKKHHHVAE
jgi:hypothetical protein